jgi:hypothetical protein
MLVSQTERLFGCTSDIDRKTFICQAFLESPANRRFIIDDQDMRHV